MVEVEVWVMIDQGGEYEVAKEADELQAPAGMASRLVKVTVSVPTPKAVELVATVADEPAAAELAVA